MTEIWEMAKIFGKWLRYMVHGLSICDPFSQNGT